MSSDAPQPRAELAARQSAAEAVLRDARVMPVLAVDSVDQGLHCVEALAAGGLRTIELVLRTPAALDALAAIKQRFPDCRVGAGTVLEPGQVRAVEDIGADFIVTPGVSPRLLAALLASTLPIVPGAATPSELLALSEQGVRVAKLFPAAALGGVDYIKALAGPLPETLLCANGGIDASSAAAYLALPSVLCVGGSWMVPKDWLAAGAWHKVTESARRAAELATG